jgi:pimeloyl-ACP methyl ester carboxylesterase
MPHAIRLPHLKSTNVRFLFQTLARRLALRASAALAPDLAGAWAEHLFLRPPGSRAPESLFFALSDARSSYVEHRGRSLASWSWGLPHAPAVVLAHGWGGRAAQMRGFVFPLLAAGFRVVAFDQPAHGISEGRLTGLPDFADALAAVAARHGGVRAVIAHSFGGAALALALARGLALERAVLISPPSDLVGYSRRFARGYWIPERVRHVMQTAIEDRFGVRWAEMEIARLAPRLRASALVIHDRADPVVPWKQGAAFARAWPGARLLTTSGLGHGRILEAEAAVRAAADFVSGRSQVASFATPPLPNPAPLY